MLWQKHQIPIWNHKISTVLGSSSVWKCIRLSCGTGNRTRRLPSQPQFFASFWYSPSRKPTAQSPNRRYKKNHFFKSISSNLYFFQKLILGQSPLFSGNGKTAICTNLFIKKTFCNSLKFNQVLKKKDFPEENAGDIDMIKDLKQNREHKRKKKAMKLKTNRLLLLHLPPTMLSQHTLVSNMSVNTYRLLIAFFCLLTWKKL